MEAEIEIKSETLESLEQKIEELNNDQVEDNESQNIAPSDDQGQRCNGSGGAGYPFCDVNGPVIAPLFPTSYKCPYDGCDVTVAEFSILRHLHKSHPNSVEEVLVRQSLQDKGPGVGDILKTLATVKSMMQTDEGEPEDNNSCQDIKMELECPPPNTKVVPGTSNSDVVDNHALPSPKVVDVSSTISKLVAVSSSLQIVTGSSNSEAPSNPDSEVVGKLTTRSSSSPKAAATSNSENVAVSSNSEVAAKPTSSIPKVAADSSSISRVVAESLISSSNLRKSGRHQYFTRARTRRPQKKHEYQTGPKAASVRAVLQNFTLGSGFYCPECRGESRKTMISTWSVHRHLATFHPNSEILRNPSSIKLQVIQSTEDEITGLNSTLEEPGCSQNMEQISQNEAIENGDHSDFITVSSDPEILSGFRRFLQKYRLFPQISQNYSSSCPLCKEEGHPLTLSSLQNLARHIIKCHPGCDLLRKSNLDNFKEPMRERSRRPGGQKNTVSGMKTNALNISRRAKFMKYRTKCGTRFYCPDCASLKIQRTFTIVHNLVRHTKTYHKNSKLLQQRRTRGRSISEKINNPIGSEGDVQLQNATRTDSLAEIQGNQSLIEDSDFITPTSDPGTLSGFRRFLQRYRLFPQITQNYTASCPLCKEENRPATFSSLVNLQGHILTGHAGCELLRKSNLDDVIPPMSRKRPGRPLGKKNKLDKGTVKLSGFRRSGRITKMKATAIRMSLREVNLSRTRESLNAELVKYKMPGNQAQVEEDSDFITISSDSGILARFRRFLRRYRLFPEIPKNYKAFCPLCKEGNCSPSFTQIFNLSLHILKVHPGSELLRMSNLDGVVGGKLGRPLGRKNKFVAQGQIKISNTVYTDLMKYKTSCGTRFYCPDCSRMGTVQIFRVVSKLVRHLRTHHPDSELFKCSTTRQSQSRPKRGAGLASESNSEIATAPETEKSCKADKQLKTGENFIRTKLAERKNQNPKTPLSAELMKYKTNCGKRLYCPECAALGTEKTFNNAAFTVIRHLRNFHKDSDLLKLSYGWKCKEVGRGFESRWKKWSTKGKIRVSGLRGGDRVTKMRAKAINLSRGVGLTSNGIGPRPSPLTTRLMKYKTKSGFYCPDCAALDSERIFSLVGNLVRHIRIYHPNSELFKVSHGKRFRGCKQNSVVVESQDKEVGAAKRHRGLRPRNSFIGKELTPKPSSSKSASVSLPRKRRLRLAPTSKPLPSVKLSYIDSKSVEETQAKIWAEISKICSSTDPKRIQCPLCPEGKQKSMYLSYHHLFRHFERSCPTWKELYPEYSRVYLLQGHGWNCACCSRSDFSNKQSLTSHVRKEHSEVSWEENEIHAERIRSMLYTCHWCREDCQNSNGFRAHKCHGPVIKGNIKKVEPSRDNEMALELDVTNCPSVGIEPTHEDLDDNHESVLEELCSFCGELFAPQDMTDHLKTHAEDD